MPRIRLDQVPFSPRLRSTRSAGGFDSFNMGSHTIARQDPASDEIGELIRQRDEQAAQWDGYWRYTGYRVNGASEINSPASPEVPSHIRYVVTSDPALIEELDVRVPDTDRVRYADGAHGYIVDRFSRDGVQYAPDVDFDIDATLPLPQRVREIAQRFQILRRITEITDAIRDRRSSAASAPTVTIVGMPSGGITYLDGARTRDDLSRWRDASNTAWVVPASAGRHTIRVEPTEGAARTATVTVPATGNVSVNFANMKLEATPETTPSSTLRIVGMPNYGIVEIDGVRTNDSSSRWADAMLSAWIVPTTSGVHRVRVAPPTGGGAARTATVTIPETGEAVVTFSAMTPEPDAAPPVVKTTPSSTLRIVGMPNYGIVEIDGVRTNDSSSRWADAMLSAWIVPTTSGVHRVRVAPPTGGGAARTATVTIPETGEAVVTFSAMTPEPDAAPPVVNPHETVPAVTTGTVIYTPRPPVQSFSTVTGAALRPAPAVTAIPLTRVDDTWSASVPAGHYTLEVIKQPFHAEAVLPGTPMMDAVQYAADVNVVAGQTVNVSDADLRATGQTVSHGDAAPPPQPPSTTGRVIVVTRLPNVSAMIQRITNTSGSLSAGIVLTRAEDGSLTVDAPPGSYQLVAWQEAEFPSIARTNVRTAPVNVILGSTATYSYTADGLSYATSTGSMSRDTSDTSHDAVIMQELQTLAGMHASADLMLLLLS